MWLDPVDPLEESINYIQDTRTGSIVVSQLVNDLLCRAKLVTKTSEELRACVPKAINGLIDVPDGEEIVRTSNKFHQLPLERIRVLKFVHQYEVESRPNPGEQRVVTPEQGKCCFFQI